MKLHVVVVVVVVVVAVVVAAAAAAAVLFWPNSPGESIREAGFSFIFNPVFKIATLNASSAIGKVL